MIALKQNFFTVSFLYPIRFLIAYENMQLRVLKLNAMLTVLLSAVVQNVLCVCSGQCVVMVTACFLLNPME